MSRRFVFAKFDKLLKNLIVTELHFSLTFLKTIMYLDTSDIFHRKNIMETGDTFKLLEKRISSFCHTVFLHYNILCFQYKVFTNHSHKHSFSYSPRFCKFECNTTPNMV